MRCRPVVRGSRQVGLVLLLALLLSGVVSPLGTTSSWAAFSDVPSSFWAAAWIYFLVDLGIVKGFDDGTYRPGDPVTRDQMAVFIGRAFQEARLVHGFGVAAYAGETAEGTIALVEACQDRNGVPDPTQTDIGLQAGYRLLASSDGVTFAPAANATFFFNGDLVAWYVTGLKANTWFKPCAVVGLNPEVDKPLCGVLMARPSESIATITVNQPPSTNAPRLPQIAWTGVPGAVTYIVEVRPDVYIAVLEGWRTSLLFGQQAGSGIVWASGSGDALAPTHMYGLFVRAFDATSWQIGAKYLEFTTGP